MPQKPKRYDKMLTARAATRPTVSNDANASTMNNNLARTLRGSVSVGENAVAFVNDTKT
jgi:hypothetical protein